MASKAQDKELLMRAIDNYALLPITGRSLLKVLINLAIDDVVYDKFFQRQSVQAVIQENHLLLIVVNTKKEEIQKWIN